jgi:hypothetical protein
MSHLVIVGGSDAGISAALGKPLGSRADMCSGLEPSSS